jgi:two-component system response regulator (stage 0 sporulation protein F)
MNILIVDDQPNIVRVTSVALDLLGCRTFTASTTAAAEHLLATEKIDAIFLDVKLGGECGLEFLARLVAQAIRQPVVMFTAGAKNEVAAEAMQRGAFGCLAKPFNLDDLREQMTQIERHLRQREGTLNCAERRFL